MTCAATDNTTLPRPTWLGAFVRVRDDGGGEWHATVASAWVTKRTRRLTRVVLRWGTGDERRDQRRRVLRVEECNDGRGAGSVLVVGGEW